MLFGTGKLWVSIDRISMMRPTKNVHKFFPNGENMEPMDKPEWKTITNWLHWDMNPWTGKTSTYGFEIRDATKNRGYDLLKVQGILALVDCSQEAGGFHAVPGFQHHIRGWANQNKAKFHRNNTDTTFQVPEDDPIRQDTQTMPIRKGSILIWNSALPHGTYPNDSEQFRCIQYLKMAPTTDLAIRPWIPAELLPGAETGFHLSELGKKLYGLATWE